MLLNSAAFVRARFGDEAHRELLRVQPELAPYFRGSLPEGARVPLAAVVRYQKAAHTRLAPEDDGFHRDLGRFAAVHDSQGNLAHMVSDRDTLVKMLRTLWRTFFDSGSLEVVEAGERSFAARAIDFEGDPVLCERIAGVAEAHFRTTDVEHTACVFRDAPACEWRVKW